MRFLLDEFLGVLDGCANVFGSQVVFATKLLKSHAASQTAKNASHRNARVANHGFAALDAGVNNNSFVHDAAWFWLRSRTDAFGWSACFYGGMWFQQSAPQAMFSGENLNGSSQRSVAPTAVRQRLMAESVIRAR